MHAVLDVTDADHRQTGPMLYEHRMELTGLSERIGITLANPLVLKSGKARAVRLSHSGHLRGPAVPAGRPASNSPRHPQVAAEPDHETEPLR